MRTERGIAEKKLKKKEERQCWKLTRASEQFFKSFLFISVFYRAVLVISKMNSYWKKKPYVSGNYGKRRMAINVKGIQNSIEHV